MIHEAIQSLRPGKGFVMYNDDPTTIIWDDSKVTTPTKAEIDQAVIAYEQKLKTEENAVIAQKEAILAKLGITAEEVATLLA